MTASGILLETTNLSVSFGGLVAVSDVSLQVRRGEILSLIGPNGAGKTTFLNLLSGFIRPTGGSVRYEDREVTGLAPWVIAGRGLLRTFQHNSLLSNLTVMDNILAGFHCRTSTGLWGSLLRTKRYRDEQLAAQQGALEVLRQLGMQHQGEFAASSLPFGDQRKLGIGVALAARPRLLLLDEPAAGMNPDESVQLMHLIRQLRDSGITVVLVEHDMRVVMGISDRIIVLNRGQTMAQGTPAEIAVDKDVIRVYLGDSPLITTQAPSQPPAECHPSQQETPL